MKKVNLLLSTVLGILGICLMINSFSTQKNKLAIVNDNHTLNITENFLSKTSNNEFYGLVESPTSTEKIEVYSEPYLGIFCGICTESSTEFKGIINDPNTYVVDYSTVKKIYKFN